MRAMKAKTLSLILASAALLTGCDPDCEDHTFSVTLSDADPTPYTMVGELCYDGSPDGKDIEILFHGATGNQTYWKGLGVGPEYSEVHHATMLHGRATLALTALGAGDSDKPDGLTLSQEAVSHASKQVVDSVMAGGLGHDFGKVALVGHSGGAATAISIAAQTDVDAVLLTSFAHESTQAVQDSFALLHPAPLDPKFTGFTDFGYLTSIPGTREQWIYNAGFVEPAMIAADEAEKDMFAMGVGAYWGAIEQDFTSLGITAPVYIITGSEDQAFCGEDIDCHDPGALAAHEAPYFSTADFTAETVPGFAIGLHFQVGSVLIFDKMGDWLDAHL
jgi:pimeloyl-ACP methyl ester carboxylesterase